MLNKDYNYFWQDSIKILKYKKGRIMNLLFKILLIININYAYSSQVNKSEYQERLNLYLTKKLQKIILNASNKLQISEQELHRKIKKSITNDHILFEGHIQSIMGLCHLNGKVSFIGSEGSARCIDKNLKGKIIFL